MLVADLTTLDNLLNDEHYEQTFGALEYLPGLQQKLQIRQFFSTDLKFKQVLPIKNAQILHKIHLVYRSNFLRDTIYAKEEGPSLPKCLLYCCVNYTSEVMNTLITSKVYL